MKALKLTALAAAVSFGLASASQAAIMIDNFDGDAFEGNAPIVGASAGTSSGGFARTVNATEDNDNLSVAINTDPNFGVYAHSQDAGVTGQSSVSYAMGGADLAMDANAFRVGLESVDLNAIIGVEVDGTRIDVSTTDIFLANQAFPSYADFLFSDFAGVDFTNVGEVVLYADGRQTTAVDMTIDSIGTVCSTVTGTGASGTDAGGNIDSALCTMTPPPVSEPATAALLGLGLVGTIAVRRRRARKS